MEEEGERERRMRREEGICGGGGREGDRRRVIEGVIDGEREMMKMWEVG